MQCMHAHDDSSGLSTGGADEQAAIRLAADVALVCCLKSDDLAPLIRHDQHQGATLSLCRMPAQARFRDARREEGQVLRDTSRARDGRRCQVR